MVPQISITGKVFIQHHNIVFKLAYLNEVMYYNGKLWIVSYLYFSFLFRISIFSVLEGAARHRDDVLAQPPDQDYNRGRTHTAYRQYILCDMAIWEQETGVLYQVAVYGG